MSIILVVDDESAMRALYARALVESGHLTIEARTAEEGLDRLAGAPDIHVVVADLDMPGHGGAWLVEQMRGRFPNVAVILATANESVPGTLTLQAAVVSYLVKPISGDRLRDAVAEALAWHDRQSSSPLGATQTAGDPIEAWLDKKLTRPHGDGDDPTR
jgi:two-component system chemotaxis response regulator CheY